MSGITVICPNSHRCRVKVSPATQLKKVLEEACLKQGFDVSKHELRHGGRTLDLSLSFRLSGLPNNITVEMVPSESKSTGEQVQIALQLADGTRLTSDFCSKVTLLNILETFSELSKTDLIHCGDGLAPSCAYMNKEYRGEMELSETTLESIGVMGGRCLMRYSAIAMSSEELQRVENRLADEKKRMEKLEEGFEARKAEHERRAQIAAEREKEFEKELEMKRKAEIEAAAQTQTAQRILTQETSRDANTNTMSESIGELRLPANTAVPTHSNVARLQYLQALLDQVNLNLDPSSATTQASVTNASHPVARDQVNQHIVQPSIVDVSTHEQMSSSQSTDETSKRVEALPEDAEKCDRAAVIIKERGARENITADVEDEDFYELTVNDVRSIRRDLKAQAGMHEESLLVSKNFLAEKNRQLKASCYKHTVVRFMIDDKNILQAQFNSLEPVSRLFEFIKENLLNRESKFTLKFVLNQELASNDSKTLLDSGISPKTTLFLKFLDSTKDMESLFSLENIKSVTPDEADELSNQWLSVNEVFRPFDPKVSVVDDVRPKTKRQSDAEHDAGPSKSKQTSSGGVPKWFQKKR